MTARKRTLHTSQFDWEILSERNHTEYAFSDNAWVAQTTCNAECPEGHPGIVVREKRNHVFFSEAEPIFYGLCSVCDLRDQEQARADAERFCQANDIPF